MNIVDPIILLDFTETIEFDTLSESVAGLAVSSVRFHISLFSNGMNQNEKKM